MKMKSYSRNTEVLSSVVLAISALLNLTSLRALAFLPIFSILGILAAIAGKGILAFCMFKSRRDNLALIGVAVLAGSSLFSFLSFGGLLPTLMNLLALASNALLLLMASAVILKKPSFDVESFRIVPAILAGVSGVLSIIMSMTGFGFAIIIAIITGLISLVISVLMALIIPSWLVSQTAQQRNAAEAHNTMKAQQIAYYQDLMYKGAITPEEFERKRWEIENS